MMRPSQQGGCGQSHPGPFGVADLLPATSHVGQLTPSHCSPGAEVAFLVSGGQEKCHESQILCWPPSGGHKTL